MKPEFSIQPVIQSVSIAYSAAKPDTATHWDVIRQDEPDCARTVAVFGRKEEALDYITLQPEFVASISIMFAQFVDYLEEHEIVQLMHCLLPQLRLYPELVEGLSGFTFNIEASWFNESNGDTLHFTFTDDEIRYRIAYLGAAGVTVIKL